MIFDKQLDHKYVILTGNIFPLQEIIILGKRFPIVRNDILKKMVSAYIYESNCEYLSIFCETIQFLNSSNLPDKYPPCRGRAQGCLQCVLLPQ